VLFWQVPDALPIGVSANMSHIAVSSMLGQPSIGLVSLYSALTRALLWRVNLEQLIAPCGLAFSVDKQCLAVCGSGNGYIALLDVGTGQEVAYVDDLTGCVQHHACACVRACVGGGREGRQAGVRLSL
jgi:hypothetical protein